MEPEVPQWIQELSTLDLGELRPSDREAVRQALDSYEYDDPSAFAERRLNIRPWSRQREILRAVARYQKVAVRSGHKVSKSNSAAILALWWLHRWPDGRVILTAPTGHQVRNILWREVTRLYGRANPPIGGQIFVTPDHGLKMSNGREIIGFSTDKTENMGGFSGAHVLFIVDEGSGVDELIFEAVEGNLAGGGKLVVFGNPTQTSGVFFDSFHTKRTHWHLIHVSSEESPNVTGTEPAVPGLATKEWIQEKKTDWGEDSPLYQMRVRGNFATQATNAIIGMGATEAARLRYIDQVAAHIPATGPLSIGVDVAGFGDDESVIWPVRGNRALEPTVLTSMDPVDVAGKVMEVLKAQRTNEEEPVTVSIDSIGIGAGVVAALRRQPSESINVVAVNVSETSTVTASDEPGYHRLRDQLWFGLRSWLTSGAIPDDDKLISELLAPVYGFTVDGKYKVEPKAETKKKIHRSPDRADALCLAVYRPIMVGFGLLPFKSPRRAF